MATATRSPLVEQAERIDRLAQHLSNGRLLEKPLRLAGSDTVWTGPIRDGFTGWMAHALDFWVRNQLAEGLRLVARSLFDRAAAVEQAAAQMLATGQVTVAPPAPPAPLNYTPGTPPAYGDIGGGATNNSYDVPEMRNLSHLLLATADEVMNFARKVDQALVPPPAPPPPPGAPPPVSPLPPDAEAAVGYPQAYIEIANQLRNASMDVAKRADLVMAAEEPLPTTTIDLRIVDTAATGAAAQVTASDQAADAAEHTEEKPPPTEEEVHSARAEGTRLAEEALDEEDVLNDPEKLQRIAEELQAHRDDPAAEAYAAAFVEKFGPKNMLAIPRALHSFKTGIPRQTTSGFEIARRPPAKVPEEDIEDVLFAFSATLATATQSDGLDQKVEEKLLGTDDRLALSWLLANPHADFDVDFLVKAFKAGVLQQLKHEAAITGLGAYGGRTAPFELAGLTLSNDPKVVVLEAIARNEEAAMRIAGHDFDPPLTIPMGLRPPAEVHNVVELLYLGGATGTGYADDGAALGRMLDTAHRGFCERGDAGNAKELVDQILGGATDKKEVKRAQQYLARIGSRQPTDRSAAQTALDRVRDEPKQPGRELLLGQMARVHETAERFAEAAAIASKNKVKESKSPELRSLRETEAAWNVIPTLQKDSATANLAQTLTEQGVRDAAEGELSDAGRRGLAKAITADAAGFARSVTLLARAPKGSAVPHHSAELEGIRINADEFAACIADLMKDLEAKRTVEAGAGNLTGAWAGQAASSYIDDLLGNPWDRKRTQFLDNQSAEMGNYLCAVIKGSTIAAENKAQAAVDALSGMRIGANIFSMGLDLASCFVPGGGALKAGGKFLFDQTIDTIKGGTGIEGLPLGLEGGLTGVMDDEIKSQEDAAWAQAKVDVDDALPLAREFVRDSMAAGLLQDALHRSSPAREQALDLLGVQPEAVQAAGLFDDNGNVKIPAMGSEEYANYTNFLSDNPYLSGAVEKASAGVADNFTDCMTDALIVKTTGK